MNNEVGRAMRPARAPDGGRMDSVTKETAAPTSGQLFWTFFRISALTIGGGYVMVPVIGREITGKRWLAEEEFYNLFAVAQSFPGPIALTTALVVGRRLLGIRGFLLAFLGILIPPFVAILLAALVLDGIAEYAPVRAFLDGAAAVIPGVVAALLWRMCVTRKWTVWRVVCAAAAVVAMILGRAWAVPIFFAAVLVAFMGELKE